MAKEGHNICDETNEAKSPLVRDTLASSSKTEKGDVMA